MQRTSPSCVMPSFRDAIAVIAAVCTGCADQVPLAPSEQTVVAQAVVARKRAEWTYHCTTSRSNGDGTYTYGVIRMKYSRDEVKRDARGESFEFVFASENSSIPWAARCLVPRSAKAVNDALARLGTNARIGGVGLKPRVKFERNLSSAIRLVAMQTACETWTWIEDDYLADGDQSGFYCGSIPGITVIVYPTPPAPPPPPPDIPWEPLLDWDWGGGMPPSPPPPTNPEVTISLNCTNSVVRGGSVSCAATPSIQEDEGVSLAWSFAPRDTVADPVAGPGGQETAWGGTMVLSGWITVELTFDGNMAQDTEYVAVTARGTNWTDTPRSFIGRIQAQTWGNVPYLTVSTAITGPWGDNVQSSGASGASPTGSATVSTVSGGPNAGYKWVSTHTIAYNRAYRLNRYLDSTAPNDIRVGPGGTLTNRYNALLAVSLDPNLLRNGTINHETYGGTAGTAVVGHQRGVEEGLHRDHCGNRVGRLEGVAGRPSYVDDMVTTVQIHASNYVLAAGGLHVRVGSHFSNVPIAVRTAAVDTALFLNVGDHARDTTGIGSIKATSSHCNFSRLGL